MQPLRHCSYNYDRPLCVQTTGSGITGNVHRGKINVNISTVYCSKMLIIYGDSNTVSTEMWNGKRVWVAGKSVSEDVVQTYMGACIMVVERVSDLKPNMEGIYVINEGGADVSEEAVLRGAFCMNCTMKEGLWRLKQMV